MPRTEKEPRLHKYNRQYLEVLPRKRLQALAKQEGIRANMSSEDIIGQIMQSGDLQQVSEDEQTKRQGSPLTSVTDDEAPANMISQRNTPRQEEVSEEILNLGHIMDARRLLTQINNERTSSESDLDDIREILTHANAEITKTQSVVKDMIEVRIDFEENIVKRLHIDQHLWDGTGLMPARHRARWRAFVESRRKERAKTVGRPQLRDVQD